MKQNVKINILKPLSEVKDYKLCYVEETFAVFTSIDLEDQWGDDWNDAPYDCNAGFPYDDHKEVTGTDENGEPIIDYNVHHDLFLVHFDNTEWEQPCEVCMNCRYSVQAINRGDVAWLRPKYPKDGVKPIMGGTTLKDFLAIMSLQGTRVYYPIEINAVNYEFIKTLH